MPQNALESITFNWGRRVIAKHAGKQSGELDYLLESPDDRVGALGFGLNNVPPAPLRDVTWRSPENLSAQALSQCKG
jgi:hypothetical protein